MKTLLFVCLLLLLGCLAFMYFASGWVGLLVGAGIFLVSFLATLGVGLAK